MTSLKTIEFRLKKRLQRLKAERAKIEEKLTALELIKEEVREKLEVDEEDEEPSQALEPETAKDETQRKISEPRDHREDLEASLAGGLWNTVDAVLEVLKIFEKPLKVVNIVEELRIAGFSFNGDKPENSARSALEALVQEGKVQKIKMIDGTFFGLPDY